MRTPRGPFSMLLAGGCALLAVASAVALLAGGSPAAAATTPSTYDAVTPTRILDTGSSPVGAGHTVILPVEGIAPLPSTGVSAVALNVTVVAPTRSGYITVYPDGDPQRPAVSNLNFVAGQTVPNLVVVQVQADGKIRLYNGSTGTVRLLADVSGYFTGSAAPISQGAFGAVPPRRLLDTRTGIGGTAGPVGVHQVVSVRVTGNTIPAGVSSVVLNVTVTSPSSSGYVTAYPHGARRPTASNLNFAKGQTVPNLVVAPVGAGGRVDLYNGSGGTVQLLADISGYFLAGDPVGRGAFGGLAPVRLLDTRAGIGAAKAAVPAVKALTVAVGGRGGVPKAHVAAVVLNVTAVAPTSSGYLTVYASNPGATRPKVSNLNFRKGQTVPNLVMAPVTAGGTVTFYNGSGGTVQIVADVSGYVLSTDAPLPATTSVSRYVRNITGAPSDTTTMHAEGQADAAGGSKLVLLDIGAQLNDKTGVALTATQTTMTYAQLVTALQSYLEGFGSVPGATIAVATNNDANDWTHYPAQARGQDWAGKVVDSLAAPEGVAVVGASDIEGDFFSTEAQAETWEAAYLGAATTKKLIFAGSADGCPTAYGATGSCNHGWTQQQYYTLAGGANPSQIQALPQSYVPEQAVQWANIDAAGGRHISFAGALTENHACPVVSLPDCPIAALAPTEGWATLYHSLSTLLAAPIIPVVTDLQVDK